MKPSMGFISSCEPARRLKTARPFRGLLIGVALAACASHSRTAPEPTRAPMPAALTSAETEDTAQVIAEIRSPSRVRYDPTLLTASRPAVRITVHNHGTSSMNVSDLRVRLEATRDGVPFRCANEVGPPARSRETQTLASGTSAVFERTLDCALPLVGTYSVRVVVAFGHASPWTDGMTVQTLELKVTAPTKGGPQAVQGVPGLWAAVGAGGIVSATSSDTAGKLVVALVNGGPTAIDLPPLRLALRVYRAGSSIPCEDEPIRISAPTSLAPGRTHVEVLQVSCLALGKPGHYDIAARLLVHGGSESELSLGRLHVEVSSDPGRLDPARVLPWSR